MNSDPHPARIGSGPSVPVAPPSSPLTPPSPLRTRLTLLAEKWRLLALSLVLGSAGGFWVSTWFPVYEVEFHLVRDVSALDLGPQSEKWSELLRPWSNAALAELANRCERPSAVSVSVRNDPAGKGIVSTLSAGKSDFLAETASRMAARIAGNANAYFSNQVYDVSNLLKARRVSVDSDLKTAGLRMVELQRDAGSFSLSEDATASLASLAQREKEIEDLQLELGRVNAQISAFLPEISRQASPELAAARAELSKARRTWTDEHPLVKQLLSSVSELEKRQAAGSVSTQPIPSDAAGDGVGGRMYLSLVELKQRRTGLQKQIQDAELRAVSARDAAGSLQSKHVEFAQARGRYQALQQEQRRITDQEHSLGWVQSTAAETIRLAAPIESPRFRQYGGALGPVRSAFAGAVAGFWTCCLTAVLIPPRRSRIRSLAELAAASRLPVLDGFSEGAASNGVDREAWGAGILARLRQHAGVEPHQALICGWISQSGDDGRSTWIRLLTDSAARQGYRVLVVSPKPRAGSASKSRVRPASSPAPSGTSETTVAGAGVGDSVPSMAMETSMDSWKSREGWTPQGRTAWSKAVHEWKAEPNLVVFIEIPRSSAPDFAVLSEEIPIGVWLCTQDLASAGEIAMRADVLMKSGSCRWLAGLHHSRRRNRGWRAFLGGMFLAFFLTMTVTLHGQDTPAVRDATPSTSAVTQSAKDIEAAPAKGSFSVVNPENLAWWQKKLTLGSGDVLSLGLYGEPDTMRPGLAIGPDGRLSFLEIKDFPAAGLTVDELRTQLEEKLAKLHRSPRLIVNPSSYQSKKYYLLGSVQVKGPFPLERPLTVLEAIARAKGFETSYAQRTALVMADLTRSFWVRRDEDGKFRRMNVDFESLFLRGDLSQNQALAPDDYLYFPPLEMPEVYVLGEVRSPGVLPYDSAMTVLKAIASKGGYSERAFKGRILVIRGSLTEPKTFVVNIAEIMSAKVHDMKLEPKDIVYVSRKPWAKSAELLETAINAFANSVVVTWTGLHVQPIITEPIF